MSQNPSEKPFFTFPKWANYLLPVAVLSLVGGAMVVPALAFFGLSPKTLASGYQPLQPVPYSHAKHLGMGLKCETCHNTVYEANFASVPSAEVCIRCHAPTQDAAGKSLGGQQVHANSPALKALHAAWNSGRPVRWTKVHDVAEYAYFAHAAHTNRGIGCASCHGRIDQMGGAGTNDDVAGVYQFSDLSMGWCLDCHRDPAKNLRPLDQITNMEWSALKAKDDPKYAALPGLKEAKTEEEAQAILGAHLHNQFGIRSTAYMQSCSTCHR